MNFNKLDEYLTLVQKSGVPLGDLVVYKDGKKVYARKFGQMDDGRPITSDDYYFMFSTTKVITCTAVMRLVEEGKIDLDAPLSYYFPENKDVLINETGKKPLNPVKIRNLMSMTSGYSYNCDYPHFRAVLDKNENATTMELVNALASENIVFEPGTHFLYGFSHDILAGLVEKVSGRLFSEYVSENIFKPLGMNNSFFHSSDKIKNNFCPQYRFDESNNTFVKQKPENTFIFTDNYDSGGAGLISTVNDYIKFAVAMANKGTSYDGYKLLSMDSINKMRTPQLNESAIEDYWKVDSGYNYGLGVRTLVNTNLSKSPIGEFGWDGAACSYVAIDTDTNVAIFFGTHILGWGEGYQHHIKFRDYVYEGLQN